jgi:hypothetical protein
MLDQPGHTPGEHARLARTGTRKDEQRTCSMFHCLPLRGIQSRQQVTANVN